MIFGEPENFAIEALPVSKGDESPALVHFCYWISGQTVGDRERVVELQDLVDDLSISASWWKHRWRVELTDLAPDEILDLVCERTRGGYRRVTTSTLPEIQANWGLIQAIFCLCPGNSEAFDNWDFVIYEYGGHEQLVWKHMNDWTAKWRTVSDGSFEKLVRAFTLWTGLQARY